MYKQTTTAGTFTQSRNICKGWGGDLIVFGYQDFEVKKYANNLKVDNRYI